jgi:hypothetical protein
VHPRTGRSADPFLDDIDERRDIVVGRAFPFENGVDVERGPFPDLGRVFARNDAEFGPRLAREDLYFEPRAELRFVGE